MDDEVSKADVAREIAAMVFILTVSRWSSQIAMMRATQPSLSEFTPILEARLSADEIEALNTMCSIVDAAVDAHNARAILRMRKKELAQDNA